MVTPRSIQHALTEALDGLRLRSGRTEDGERGMMLERRPLAPEAPTEGEAPPPVFAPNVRSRSRFIDDNEEVTMRRGILRAARDGYDLFIGEDADVDRLARYGSVERVRVPTPDGVGERPAVRFTPEVRREAVRGVLFARGDAPAPDPRDQMGTPRRSGARFARGSEPVEWVRNLVTAEPRDLILDYNDGVDFPQMALDWNFANGGSVTSRLQQIRTEAKQAEAEGRLPDLMSRWRVTEDELRAFLSPSRKKGRRGGQVELIVRGMERLARLGHQPSAANVARQAGLNVKSVGAQMSQMRASLAGRPGENRFDPAILERFRAVEEKYPPRRSSARYARGDDAAPVTAADIEERIRDEFADAGDALLDSGRVLVVDTIDDARELLGDISLPDWVGAFYIDGTTYVIAHNVEPDGVRGLMLHEVGAHAGWRNIIGDKAHREIMDRLRQLEEEGDEAAVAAWAEAREYANNPDDPNEVAEEALAYYVQYAPDTPEPGSLIERIIQAVRDWLVRNFPRLAPGLNDADLRRVALASLERVARDAGEFRGEQLRLARSQGYEGNDAGEAAEWVRARAKGLDMSEQARMARAREMGFDERDWYHGSPDARGVRSAGGFESRRNNTSYLSDQDRYEQIQREMTAERATHGDSAAWPTARYMELLDEAGALHVERSSPRPVYMTNREGVARTYARADRAFDYQGSEPEVMSLRTRGKMLIVDAHGARFANLELGIIRSGIPQDRLPEFDALVRRYQRDFTGNGGRMTTNDLEAIAFEMGYDGFEVRNVRDTYNADANAAPSTVRAVFDPRNIRSRFAAFDPDYSESANLLASARLDGRPHFYSAVERTIEAAQTQRAPGAQWWATISKAPGVKREELEWIGLEDFLRGQEGAVSREDVLAFVRANGVRVEEVTYASRGASGPTAEQVARQRFDLEWAERDAVWEEWQYEDALNRASEKYRALPEDEQERYDNAEQYMEDNGGVWGQYTDDELDSAKEEAWSAVRREYEENARWDLQDQADVADADQSDPTKWSSMTLPGGENYTELLLTLPGDVLRRAAQKATRQEKELFATNLSFRSSHWSEPNVLAHVRFKERVDSEGRRTLFLEEVQSDWHQGGRGRGYKGDAETQRIEAKLREAGLEQGVIDTLKTSQSAPPAAYETILNTLTREELAHLRAETGSQRVPNAPFKNNAWAALVLKRMIRWAAENDFEQIAWIPGRIQNGREVGETGDNRGAFYDRILPNIANDLGKKYGARVGDTQIAIGADLSGSKPQTARTETVHSLPITPEMRTNALRGQPLFARGSRAQQAYVPPQVAVQVARRHGYTGDNPRGAAAFLYDMFARGRDFIDAVAAERSDYRTVKAEDAGSGMRGSGVAEMAIGNSVAASAGGVAAVVTANEAGRKQRTAEADKARLTMAPASDADRRRVQQKSRHALLAAIQSPDDMPADASIEETIEMAAELTGVPAEYLTALAEHESGMDPNARPINPATQEPLSSALGLYQFLGGTWSNTLAAHGRAWGHTGAAGSGPVMDLRRDPRWASIMAAEFTRDNVRDLSARLNRPVTHREAYLAHFMGLDGAVRLIEAARRGEPNAAAAFPDEARANPSVFRGRSAAEVIELQGRDFSEDVIELGEPVDRTPPPSATPTRRRRRSRSGADE